ncbi:hypothetical protein [Vibrio taketomensis]|uniref:hypothetical protein n=1 Tax=Vibrio taketomensis TaxID=2572923 RepID=UPI001E3E2B44|nr:hypothetical protein [Vibrio taketomensis]
MEFKKALVNARHHVVFILGLATALVIAFGIESRHTGLVLGNITFEAPESIPLKESRVLTTQEYEGLTSHGNILKITIKKIQAWSIQWMVIHRRPCGIPHRI